VGKKKSRNKQQCLTSVFQCIFIKEFYVKTVDDPQVFSLQFNKSQKLRKISD